MSWRGGSSGSSRITNCWLAPFSRPGTPCRVDRGISSRLLASSPRILPTSLASTTLLDAFSRQYDDESEAVAVHSVVHTLSDVNLAELAREQRPIEIEPASSLELRHVRFPGVDTPIVCNTSLRRPRVLVPESRQHSIFDAIHGLAHPSGKATLAIIARSYVWWGMRRDVLQWAGQCKACATSKAARHTSPPVMPIPAPGERFSQIHVDIVGQFSPDQGFRYLLTMVDRTTRWPEGALIAGTTADTVLQSFLALGHEIWNPGHCCYGSRRSIHLRDVEKGVDAVGSLHHDNNCLSSAGERDCGTVPPDFEGRPPVCCPGESIVDAISPMGDVGAKELTKAQHVHFYCLGVVRIPLRVPGMCFQDEQLPRHSAAEQLLLVRANMAAFTPEMLDLRRFRTSPFIAKTLPTAAYVYVRDDRLGKCSLSPKYTGPFKVISRDWGNNTFLLDFGKRQDTISLSWLKEAALPEEASWPCFPRVRTGGRDVAPQDLHGAKKRICERREKQSKISDFGYILYSFVFWYSCSLDHSRDSKDYSALRLWPQQTFARP